MPWPPRHIRRLHVVALVLVLLTIAGCMLWISDPVHSRAAMIAGICLVLWLLEVLPVQVTTIVLWAGIIGLLAPLDASRFGPTQVMHWAAQPILVLFLGGMALSVACVKHGIDANIAAWMVRVSRGRRLLLLFTVIAGTAVLSMWISNVAAAAMMVVTLRPLLGATGSEASFRTALLLGIAFAADFGGMATPIGTGPNLIAIGAIASQHRITFLNWMAFALPLTVLMLAIMFALLARLYRVSGRLECVEIPHASLSRRGWVVVGVFLAAVAAWLSEPLHGVTPPVVAGAATVALFAGGLLHPRDVRKIEWGTLLLVAGGLTLGELLRASGLAHATAAAIPWASLHPMVLVLMFVLVAASLAAVASNTAAAALLIQIGLSFKPDPWFAIVIAMAVSMGVPFSISTPPNAMVIGQGVRTRDLFVPGIILMLVGCAVLALTGEWALGVLGVPR